MMHFTCDQCGKELRPGEDSRFVVKIEAYPADDPALLTEEDLDEDHMEAIGELLREIEEGDLAPELDAPTKQFRYDLCRECHARFVSDPLAKEHPQKLFFSKN